MSFRSRCLFLLPLLLVAGPAALAQTATVKGPDFSRRGGPFSVLSGLNFHHIQRIEYAGRDRAAAYGVELAAEKFLVEAWVEVPRYDFNVGSGTTDSSYTNAESKLAEIEVWVGSDADDRIHDEMLEGVHGFWAVNDPGWLGRRRPAETSEHLIYKDGRYLLFRVLNRSVHHLSPSARRFVWADGKVVWFRFKRFVIGNGSSLHVPFNPDAAVDDFVESHFSVVSGGVKLYVQPMKGSFRKEFFRQYAKGTFKGAA